MPVGVAPAASAMPVARMRTNSSDCSWVRTPASAAAVISPTEWPAVTPDVDKLCRSTLDGLTQASAIEDDARVVFLTAAKAYVDMEHAAGASISIQQVGP